MILHLHTHHRLRTYSRRIRLRDFEPAHKPAGSPEGGQFTSQGGGGGGTKTSPKPSEALPPPTAEFKAPGALTDKNGKKYDIHHEVRGGRSEYNVYDPDNPDNGYGGHVAGATLRADKTAISAVHTRPEYQRKGVASALYDLINRHQGITLGPNAAVTPEGKAFWKARQGEGGTSTSKGVELSHQENANLQAWKNLGEGYAALKSSPEFAETLKKLPQSEGDLWRGSLITPEELQSLKEGGTFTTPSNMSTVGGSGSKEGGKFNEASARVFTGKLFPTANYEGKTAPVVYKFTGTHGAELNKLFGSGEVVLPMGTSFKVEKIEHGATSAGFEHGTGGFIPETFTRVTLRG